MLLSGNKIIYVGPTGHTQRLGTNIVGRKTKTIYVWFPASNINTYKVFVVWLVKNIWF